MEPGAPFSYKQKYFPVFLLGLIAIEIIPTEKICKTIRIIVGPS
jgi:hypothetical protein